MSIAYVYLVFVVLLLYNTYGFSSEPKIFTSPTLSLQKFWQEGCDSEELDHKLETTLGVPRQGTQIHK